MEKKTDIIVVGYPKSGTTWLVQLVAELVGCPVVGFLGASQHEEVAREGLDRRSPYQCFKSHHQLGELLEIETNTQKVIYVIRDPRDVCLSGAKYFQFDRLPSLRYALRTKRVIYRRIYRWVNDHLLITSNYRINKMMRAMTVGSRRTSLWMRIPWRDHYGPYLESGYFFVRYEDVLDHPEQECRRILSFLGVERDDQHIAESIERQSFHKKKRELIGAGETGKARILRIGEKEQWREALSGEQKAFFESVLGEDLARFGYPLS